MEKTELLNKLEQQKDKALTSNKGVVTSIAKLQDAQNVKPVKQDRIYRNMLSKCQTAALKAELLMCRSIL